MFEADAIELAQNYLESISRKRGSVRFAKLIKAGSSEWSFESYQNDTWEIYFDIEIPDIEPDFFVLQVDCRTGAITEIPIM